MYLLIRGAILVVLVVFAATAASAEVATMPTVEAMSQGAQQFLTGLAGVLAGLMAAGVFVLLLAILGNRE